MDTPMGCNCGAGECWDGVACVDDPPPQPVPRFPAAILPPNCLPKPEPARIESAAVAVTRTAGHLADVQCTAAWARKLLDQTRRLGAHPAVFQAVACLERKVFVLRGIGSGIDRKRHVLAEATHRSDLAAVLKAYAFIALMRQDADREAAEVGSCFSIW